MASIQVFFVGNVGGEVTNSVTPNGHENIKFSVAVNEKRGGNDTTTWLRCTAWGSRAKGLTTLAQSGGFASGAQVVVAGTLTSREYQDRNGTTRTSLDVDAQSVDIVKYAGGDRRDDARAQFRQGMEAQGGYEDMSSVPF